MKNPVTPAGIEPATFRCVAQHHNHCATAVPVYQKYKNEIITLTVELHLSGIWLSGSPIIRIGLALQVNIVLLYLYRGAEKSLAEPGRKQANVSVRMA